MKPSIWTPRSLRDKIKELNIEILHLDEVTILKGGSFRLKGRVVTSDFVGGDTGGESYAFFHLLLSINLSELNERRLIKYGPRRKGGTSASSSLSPNSQSSATEAPAVVLAINLSRTAKEKR